MTADEAIETLQAVNGIFAILKMSGQADETLNELVSRYALASDIAIDAIKTMNMLGKLEFGGD